MRISDFDEQLYGKIVRSIIRVYQWDGFLARVYDSINDLIVAYSKRNLENPGDRSVSEGNLKRAGYEMMVMGDLSTTTDILTLDAELYPKSVDCYDSLVEAYVKNGDCESAVSNYKKALEILDTYPEENKSYNNLRDNVTRHLKELQK